MEGICRQPSNILRCLAIIVMAVTLIQTAEAACPSSGTLISACSKYVTGSNPPVPTANGGCCSLLKSTPASCICQALPSNYRQLVNPKGVANVQAVCKVGISC